MEIETVLKMKIDKAIFNDLPIKKKRILLRKLKRDKLEPKYINMFIGLLEFMEVKSDFPMKIGNTGANLIKFIEITRKS